MRICPMAGSEPRARAGEGQSTRVPGWKMCCVLSSLLAHGPVLKPHVLTGSPAGWPEHFSLLCFLFLAPCLGAAAFQAAELRPASSVLRVPEPAQKEAGGEGERSGTRGHHGPFPRHDPTHREL